MYKFLAKYSDKKIAVAVSGGADSMALMHMVSRVRPDAFVITVDHGLREASAREAKHVARIAQTLGLKHATLRWAGPHPATGVEHAARTARYKLMTDYARENNIAVILLAHQADDQIETFFMNLARGSGVYGLAGIRAETTRDGIILARPLLHTYRADLEKYCRDNQIEYCDDPMNRDEKFARVKIRKNRARAQKMLGLADDRIILAIDNLDRARSEIESDVTAKIREIAHDGERVIFGAAYYFAMADESRLKFLSELLQQTGGQTYPPRFADIAAADSRLKSDCKFTLSHCIIRRLGARILVAPEGASVSFKCRGGISSAQGA